MAGIPGADATTVEQGGALKIDSGTVVLTGDTFSNDSINGDRGGPGGFGGNGGNGGNGGSAATGAGGNGGSGGPGAPGGNGGSGGDAQGGAIYNAGSLTISGSTFSSDSANGGPGGVSGFGGFGGRGGGGGIGAPSGNGGGGGDGAASGAGGPAGNGEGGAIYNAGTLHLTGTAFTGNQATGGTGGFVDGAGQGGPGAGASGGNGGAGGRGGNASGGGLFDAGSTTYSGVSFTSNSATGGSGGAGAAGGSEGGLGATGGAGGAGGIGGNADGGAAGGTPPAGATAFCTGNTVVAGVGGAGGAAGFGSSAAGPSGNAGTATEPGAPFCTGTPSVPTIDSVSPAAGPLNGGNTVTITGSGFQGAGLTLTSASFDPTTDTNGSAALAGTSATVVSDSVITVTAPNATTAAAGKATLATRIGASFADSAHPGIPVVALPASPGDNAYTFGSPMVTAVSPPGGPITGGNTVTITGTAFEETGLSLDKVSFDPAGDTTGTAAIEGTNATVMSATEITVTAPDATTAAAGASLLEAAVKVSFTDAANPGTPVDAVAGSPTANAYTFGAPVISSVSPVGGPLAGTNTVTITGTGFKDAVLTLDKVEFDPAGDTTGSAAIEGTNATVVSGTEITVTAPDATTAAAGASLLETAVKVSFVDAADPGTPIDARAGSASDNSYTFGAPVISSVRPVGGPLAGANTVTITGTGFQDAVLTLDKVEFDPAGDTTGSAAIEGTSATVISDTEITVTAPDATTAAAGKSLLETAVKVSFIDAANPATPVDARAGSPSDAAYTFGAPVVTKVSPIAGPLGGGNTVTITGTGFEDPGLTFDAVTFDPSTDTTGSAAIDGTGAILVSDTEITVTAPDATSAADGKATLASVVDVSFLDAVDPATPVLAVNAAGANDYDFGTPVIDSVSPPAGPLAGGNTVIITGNGFLNPALTLDRVTFNPANAPAIPGLSPTVVSDTEITVTAPDATTTAGQTSLDTAVDVLFTDAADPSTPLPAVDSTDGASNYIFATPQIDSVSPTGGPLAGGNTVTITGSGFRDAGLSLNKVTFDPTGTAALTGSAAVVVSDTEITVTAPDATSAAAGQSDIQSLVNVYFDDPSDPANLIASSATSTGANAYLFGAPEISSVSPPAGPLAGGNTVTITGKGFMDTGLTMDRVTFDPTSDTNGTTALDGVSATVVSDTEITVTAPDATAAARGTSTVQTQINVLFTDAADPSTPLPAVDSTDGASNYIFATPQIDSVSPTGGPLAGGNTVTITGSGFRDAGLSLNKVTFDPTGTAALTGSAAVVVSDTEITVTAPDATSAAAGQSDIQSLVNVYFDDPSDPANLIASSATSTGANAYLFGAPEISSVSPPAGPLAGGNTVTITGKGFMDTGLTMDRVTFDPTSDTNGTTALDGVSATVVSDTEITVTAPDATAAARGTSTVQTQINVLFTDAADPSTPLPAVDSTDGASNYIFATPQIDSVSPTGGPLAGGNTVTITGSGFRDAGLSLNKVTFDPTGTAALTGSAAVVVSDTEITVTAPDATSAAAGQSDIQSLVNVYFDDPSDPANLIASSATSTGANAYLFGAPEISSVSPPAGPLAGGNTVTITGKGFMDTGLTMDRVTFDPTSDTNGTTALDGVSATVVSDTEITVTAPDATAAARGTSTVQTQINVLFTDAADPSTPLPAVDSTDGASNYIFATPQIDSVSPTGGPLAGGNTVTITGSGFRDAGLSLNKVTFDPTGTAALTGSAAVVVSDTEITVTAPDATSAAAGQSDIQSLVNVYFDDPSDPANLIASSATSTGANAYLFGTPEISSVSPPAGPLAGGNTVTITGKGFMDTGLTMDRVTFDSLGGTPVTLPGTDPVVVSDTEITVTAPDATGAANGTTMAQTEINILFTDAADPSTPLPAVDSTDGASNYLFGEPQIDSVSPTGGPLAGGDTVTITGSGFRDSGLSLNKVTFDPAGDTTGAAAIEGTNAVVVSDTEITVTAPDATSAAAGQPELATTVDVFFDDPSDPADLITSVPKVFGDNGYVFGAISPPAPPEGAVSSQDCTSSTEAGTCNVIDAGTTVSADGEGAVTVAQYAADPVGTPTFSASGEYFDVHVAPRSDFSTLTITACNLMGATSLRWWDGSAWIDVSPQSYSAGPPACVTATLSSTSSPTIAQLTGTVFAGVLPAIAPTPPKRTPTGVLAATPTVLAATGGPLSQLFIAGAGSIALGTLLLSVAAVYRRRRPLTPAVGGQRAPR